MSFCYVIALMGLHLVWGNDLNRLHGVLLHYIRNVYRLMGIRVEVQGELPEKPSIYMGNHRSYVDAVLVPAKHPIVFVARSESKNWPIIGWGASLMGTIWVDRKDPASRKNTRETVKTRLQNGLGIIIFPEGTTHIGPDILEYRPGMFYISAEGGFPITPIALEYKDPNIAWVGQSKFIPHAWKHFGKRHIDIKLSIGETLSGDDGAALLKSAREWTEKEVMKLRKEWDS
jgi:1-acyl-sn-glycerol-3-phosphate acyltransferase